MSFMLTPLSLAYGATVGARSALYRAGVLRVERVDAPVLSVGNITAGGTGKTPLVEWLARACYDAGRRVCVLTRGYKRANPRARVLVSDGERVLAGAPEGGDEPRLLAERLRRVAAVVSDPDRVAAARWAHAALGSDAFILDDGFQHLRLARDLDVVTLDATDPLGGGHMLPRGRLREPARNLSRADVIVITRAELADELSALRERARQLSGGRTILAARTRTLGLRPLTVSPSAADLIPRGAAAQPLVAFCALGNPRAFFTHLRREGYSLTHTRAFPDHHAYTQGDVEALTREAVRLGARAFVTTAKDAVKLRALQFSLPCYALEITVEFDEVEKMRGLVREALSRR